MKKHITDAEIKAKELLVKYTIPVAIETCERCILINKDYKRRFPFQGTSADNKIRFWKAVIEILKAQ